MWEAGRDCILVGEVDRSLPSRPYKSRARGLFGAHFGKEEGRVSDLFAPCRLYFVYNKQRLDGMFSVCYHRDIQVAI